MLRNPYLIVYPFDLKMYYYLSFYAFPVLHIKNKYEYYIIIDTAKYAVKYVINR